MAKYGVKVVRQEKPEVWAEVMVDNISADEEEQIMRKLEDLAIFVANIKGLRIEGQKGVAIG